MKPIDVNLNDYCNVVATFHTESDRAAAVLAGSFLESFLAKYLQSQMVDDPCVSDLFHGFGPFAAYKQRVDTAYAFGLIPKGQRDDLNVIGKIRNHFAHHPLEAAFDMSPVCDWCSQLSTYHIYPMDGQVSDIKQDNRNRYLVAIGMNTIRWANAIYGQVATALHVNTYESK